MPAAYTQPLTPGSLRFDGGNTVLVPVDGDRTDPAAVELAVDIARGSGGDVLLMASETKPRPISFERDLSAGADRELEAHVRYAVEYGRSRVPVDGCIGIGSSRARTVLSAVETYGVDTLVKSGWPASITSSIREATVGTVIDQADCDVVVTSRIGSVDTVTSILVPVSGGPHSGLAIDTARVLADTHGAEIDLFSVSESREGEDDRSQQVLDAAVDRLGEFEDYDTWLFEADDVADAIIDQSRYYSVTALGWPRKGRLQRFVAGSTTERVAKRADSPVLTVRSEMAEAWVDRWLARGS